ncbi:MAG: ABC transporter substrate-binding protein [Thermodesulfobacteriota bacterium]
MNNLQCRRERMKRISIILTVPLLLFCYTAVLGETRGVTKDTITVGYLTANTGPIAKDSQAVSSGVRNYIRYVNEQGGINGRKIKVIYEDTGYSIPRALASFKKLLYRDQVLTFFGPTSTGETTVLFSQIGKEKIAILTISPSQQMFKPFHRYVFHIFLSYENCVEILFDYIINDMKARNPKISIVYPNIDVGKGPARVANERAKMMGVELQDVILEMNELDATSQVLSMKRFNPDIVIIQGLVQQASLLLRDARKLGLKTNFLGTLLSTNEDIISLAKEAYRGFIGVHSARSIYEDAPGAKKMKEITLRFYPGEEKSYSSKLYTYGWAYAILFMEAMKRAGKELDNENLVKAMEGMKGFSPWGLVGPVNWSPNNREGSRSGILYKPDIEKGILIPISDWREPISR